MPVSAASLMSGEPPVESGKKMPFRELTVRPKMAVPDWLPDKKGSDGFKYDLSLVNGVYQMFRQEVRRCPCLL